VTKRGEENIYFEDDLVNVKETSFSSLNQVGFDFNLLYEEGSRRYGKAYLPNKYKTTVIVFEGKVIAADYDEKGGLYNQGTIIGINQKYINRKEVGL
jgi:hypothetical protein